MIEAVAVEDPEDDELKVMVPGPLTCVHKPPPLVGVLPPSEPLIRVPHKFCADPTVAVVGVAELVTVTVLLEGVQTPLLMVHWNTYTPAIILVTVELYAVGLVIAGLLGPLTRVHNPVFGDVGLFPARVVPVKLQRF